MIKYRRRLALLIVIMSVGCLTAQAEHIGVSLPLTGPAATYGVDIKNIFSFLNDLKGPQRHELIFEDDKCNPKEAVTIAQRFIATPGLRFVMGYACSGTIMATAPIYEKHKIILMSAAAAAPSVSQAGDFIFRTRPSELGAADLLAQYVGKHFSSIELMNEETEYAQSISDAFAKALKIDTKAARRSFQLGATDLDSLLLRAKAQAPQALIVFSQAESGLLTVVQAVRRLHWRVPLITSIFPPAPTFLQAAGADAEGIIFATLPFFEDAASPEAYRLLNQFLAKYGPMQSTDHLFFTSHAAFLAVDYLTRTSGEARQLLYSTTFPGLYGPFSFDANGDIQGINYLLKKIENGRAVNLNWKN